MPWGEGDQEKEMNNEHWMLFMSVSDVGATYFFWGLMCAMVKHSCGHYSPTKMNKSKL